MNPIIETMLARYKCKSLSDYENALKEIIQEIALLALWRGKFFEAAAFYGGSALRIIYHLDRFSEDLDFSLLASDRSFTIEDYFPFLRQELRAFGFNAEVQKGVKNQKSAIESAFIKANTLEHLIMISVADKTHKTKKLQIKFEVDIDPPLDFETESKYVLLPVPFSVRVYKPSCLFAGKMHALLFRKWKHRVKGRDWYDFVWFVGQNIPLNLKHLTARMVQSEQWPKGKPFTQHDFSGILKDKIESLNVEKARNDVAPFLRNQSVLEIWSREFFSSIIGQIAFED